MSTRSDLEYETLFYQLLEMLAEKSSRGYLRGWLIANKVNETELLEWFERFGERQRNQPSGDETLLERLQILGQVDYGKLSSEAFRLATDLLPETPPLEDLQTLEQVDYEVFQRARNLLPDASPPPRRPTIVATQFPPYAFSDAISIPASDLFCLLPNTSPPEPSTWFCEGLQAYEVGRLDLAFSWWYKSLRFDPCNPYTYNGLGIVYDDWGDYEKAIASYDEALRIDCTYWQVWINRSFSVRVSSGWRQGRRWWPSVMESLVLDLRGYKGAVGTLQVGLKYVPIRQEGEGRLHYELGRAHYAQAQILSQPYDPTQLRQQATDCYRQALSILNMEWFGEARLEVLQDLIFPLQDLGQFQEADGVRQEGIELLQRLLAQAQDDPDRISQLEQKFAQLRAMTSSAQVQ